MTERILGPSGSKRRHTRLLVLTALTTAAFAVFFVAASSANLPSSPASVAFEDNDGNLTAGNFGGTFDWNGPLPDTLTCPASPGAGTNCGVDKVSDSSDDALGQGAKEDDESPSVVTGSIPPSKDDLSRFYVSKQKTGGKNYLYLAWERSNLLGSAHMDFEFNQSASLAPNGVSPVRTAGDLLIDFDFGGSGVPGLFKHTWITSGNPATDCEASNTLPCWNTGVNLVAAGVSEGAVNGANVTDSVGPGGSFTLVGTTAKNGTVSSTFGEAGINLTDANIFPPGQCETFGQAWLKSRSSGNSFTSELKDIIAPIPVNISNCGSIVIKKVTVPAGQTDSFGYTETVGGLSPTTFSLTGASGSDTRTYSNVPAGGPYTFVESDPTPSYDLTNLVCSAAGGTSTSTTNLSTRTASVTNLVAGETVTCTYTNTQRGSIKVVKVTNPSSDTTTSFGFTPVGFNGGASFNLMNGDGGQTFSNLVPGGSYSVSETTIPAGWQLDPANPASCDNGTPGGITVAAGQTTTCTFYDVKLFGAIRVTKLSSKDDSPLSGASFSITGPSFSGTIGPTGADGTACIDNLPFVAAGSNYTVTETTAPGGYAIDNASGVIVTVNQNASCSSGTPNVPASAFTDTPLSRITVSFDSLADGNPTSATIDCGPPDDPQNPPALPEGTPRVLDNLLPGTYTCSVVVDP